MCVHARDAIDECIAEIERARLDFSNAVFHCFAGSPEKLAELNERGARASFTGIITYRNAGEMRAAMLAQGLGKLMLETDAPYLAPVPRRGKTANPQCLPTPRGRRRKSSAFRPNTLRQRRRKTRRNFSIFRKNNRTLRAACGNQKAAKSDAPRKKVRPERPKQIRPPAGLRGGAGFAFCAGQTIPLRVRRTRRVRAVSTCRCR